MVGLLDRVAALPMCVVRRVEALLEQLVRVVDSPRVVVSVVVDAQKNSGCSSTPARAASSTTGSAASQA